MDELFLMDFDNSRRAVLEPAHEKDELHYHFQSKLLFAFLTSDAIAQFLSQYPHRIAGRFDCFEGDTLIYEVDLPGEKIALCQAKLGAAAATQLLDWLIGYGVQQVLAIGSAGSLIDLPENYFLVPTKAIRDEGTSFHYAAPSNFVDLHSSFLSRVEELMVQSDFKVKEVTTWTTDGFFRETPKKAEQFKALGASCVEMECAAMAACAQFRGVYFAQILFTADSLSDLDQHIERDWGRGAHEQALKLASQILKDL